jgi:hypothetical protein
MTPVTEEGEYNSVMLEGKPSSGMLRHAALQKLTDVRHQNDDA